MYLFYYFFTVFYLGRYFRRYDQEISLWITLCKNLKIDYFVLHKVAGTSRFSWSNDEPFENIVNFNH